MCGTVRNEMWSGLLGDEGKGRQQSPGHPSWAEPAGAVNDGIIIGATPDCCSQRQTHHMFDSFLYTAVLPQQAAVQRWEFPNTAELFSEDQTPNTESSNSTAAVYHFMHSTDLPTLLLRSLGGLFFLLFLLQLFCLLLRRPLSSTTLLLPHGSCGLRSILCFVSCCSLFFCIPVFIVLFQCRPTHRNMLKIWRPSHRDSGISWSFLYSVLRAVYFCAFFFFAFVFAREKPPTSQPAASSRGSAPQVQIQQLDNNRDMEVLEKTQRKVRNHWLIFWFHDVCTAVIITNMDMEWNTTRSACLPRALFCFYFAFLHTSVVQNTAVLGLFSFPVRRHAW